MAYFTQVITVQKDLGEPDIAITQCMTLKHNFIENSFPLHIHDHYEMEIVLSGCGMQWINGVPFSLEKGTLYLLSPEDMHRFVAKEPLTLLSVHLISNQVPDHLLTLLNSCRGGALIQLTGQEFTRIAEALEHLHQNIHQHTAFAQEEACALVTLLIVQLLRRNRIQAEISIASYPAMSHLRKALAYISAHYTSALTLRQTANACGLSPCYFSSLFTRCVGCTFSTYVMDTRLRYARRLLRQSDCTVTEIAYECGFSSLSNFLRMFRRETGLTPVSYRKNADIDHGRPPAFHHAVCDAPQGMTSE